jgi:hypothetical protein
MGRFNLWCLNEPQNLNEPIFDMVLQSISRQQVSELTIRTFGLSTLYPERQVFSTEALHRYLVGNDRLKTLSLWGLRIGADACNVIGRNPQNLDMLELRQCKLLGAQQFANGIQSNVCGPIKINFNGCRVEPDVDFVFILVPLLNNRRLKILHLNHLDHST